LICVKRLADWVKSYRHMNWAKPMMWRDPQDHLSDCYFCTTQIKGIISKSKYTVKYQNMPFAVRPVPHSEDLPIPHPPPKFAICCEASTSQWGLTYTTSSYTSNSRIWIGT
jgi:hypothetical protein